MFFLWTTYTSQTSVVGPLIHIAESEERVGGVIVRRPLLSQARD